MAVRMMKTSTESAAGFSFRNMYSNLRDTELEELITLDDVTVLVGEWIPFGGNFIAQLNEKLDSSAAKRSTQGGLFASLVDQMPDEMCLATHAEDSKANLVTVHDYEATGHVNFCADVFYDEEENIVQVEEFGVSVYVWIEAAQRGAWVRAVHPELMELVTCVEATGGSALVLTRPQRPRSAPRPRPRWPRSDPQPRPR